VYIFKYFKATSKRPKDLEAWRGKIQ